MTRSKLIASGAAALLLSCAPLMAHASTDVYNNLGPAVYAGDCSFNTACALGAGRGNEFAAQAFSLSSGASITNGSYTVLESAADTTSVNWAFYASGGATPTGTALASGSSAAVTTFQTTAGGLNVDLVSFLMPTLNLGPGNYYFAIQEVTPDFGSYLQAGLVTSGAAETHDGGATWQSGYENGDGGSQLGGISVALGSGAVPEPSTWAMMLVGVGALGGSLRVSRRRQAQASHA